MYSLHFLSDCDSGSDTSPFGPAIKTVEFSSKAACERTLNELETWAEKTYRYKNVVIARRDGVCIQSE
jgi:hypothetical protein